MGAVADLFDRNGEGLIDWQEFIAALRPDWQERKPATDADKIHDEVKRLVMLCTCRQKFRVFQVGEGKYRVSSYKILANGTKFQLKFLSFSSVTVKNSASSVFSAVQSWFELAVVGLHSTNSWWRTIPAEVSWLNFPFLDILKFSQIWKYLRLYLY